MKQFSCYAMLMIWICRLYVNDDNSYYWQLLLADAIILCGEGTKWLKNQPCDVINIRDYPHLFRGFLSHSYLIFMTSHDWFFKHFVLLPCVHKNTLLWMRESHFFQGGRGHWTVICICNQSFISIDLINFKKIMCSDPN